MIWHCSVDRDIIVTEMYARRVPAAGWSSRPSSFSATPSQQAPSDLYAAGVATPTVKTEDRQNDQFSHGELVRHNKYVFDLSEWGQHLQRSGLATGMRMHDHELARVQR